MTWALRRARGSDGGDNSGGIGADTINALRARHIPVHTVGFGREQAGHDVELTLLKARVGHGLRERRIDVADQKIDFVALDQLQCFLNRGGGVAAGRILDQEFDLAAQNSTLGINLLDGELRTDQFVLAERREGAG